MSGSIEELRKICASQAPEEKSLGMRLLRKISIRFTKVLLLTSITANQVTILSFLFGIIGGLLLIFSGWSSVIGALMLQMYCVFDLVDGEIARYRKSFSSFGLFLDLLNHRIVNPFIIVCLSIGLYSVLNDSRVFYFGFSAIICEELMVFVRQSRYLVFGRARVTQPLNEENSSHTPQTEKNTGEQALTERGSPITRALFLAIYFPFSDISKPFVIFSISLLNIIMTWAGWGSLGFSLMYFYIILYGTLLHSVWIRAALIAKRNLYSAV